MEEITIRIEEITLNIADKNFGSLYLVMLNYIQKLLSLLGIRQKKETMILCNLTLK